MTSIKAKKVILKNRAGEHLIPVVDGGGGTLNMFDTVLKDHILTYEESKGLALQGTYVYKEAIAGSRYGYSTFYNKCVEEKANATATETTLGDNTITMYINANGHQFYDIADKEAVDAWYNVYGRAWFYGVDTENERIFLPRNSKYFRIGDENTVGTNQDAGLPTHTHTRGTMNITGKFGVATDGASSGWNKAVSNGGAFYRVDGIGDYSDGTSASTNGGFGFDASRSWTGSTSAPDNDIYGNSDTVELDSVNMLLYICVGNTESEQALTNVTEITTSENDTLPWGYHFYSGELLEAPIGYIESLGQWNDGSDLYAQFFSKAVNKLGEAFAGGYIKEVTEEYDDYDLVINQTDITFRLPLLDGKRVLVAKKEATSFDDTWYNLYSDGWCEQGGFVNTIANNSTYTVNLPKSFKDMAYTVDASQVFNNSYLFESRHVVIPYNSRTTSSFGIMNSRFALETTAGISCYWSAKGYAEIPTVSEYTENINLYFKVANAVQNLELLNAGEVLEAVNNINAKVDNTVHIVESYRTTTDWYNVYSDGWIEQGGIIEFPAYTQNSSKTITYLKPFANKTCNVLAQMYGGGNNWASVNSNVQGLSNTGFTLRMFQVSANSAVNTHYIFWVAKGY